MFKEGDVIISNTNGKRYLVKSRLPGRLLTYNVIQFGHSSGGGIIYSDTLDRFSLCSPCRILELYLLDYPNVGRPSRDFLQRVINDV